MQLFCEKKKSITMTIINIEIETAIRKLSWGSFQAGQKSIQKVFVNFTEKTISSEYVTGHTEILGVSAGSIRDGFTITNKRFATDLSASFKATGATASPVGFMPNINYEFWFDLSPTKMWFWGSHDGYPSYNIAVNGNSKYDYVQGHLGQLMGDSDIQVLLKMVEV